MVFSSCSSVCLAYHSAFGDAGVVRHLDTYHRAASSSTPDLNDSKPINSPSKDDSLVTCPVHEGPVHSSSLVRSYKPGDSLLDITEPLLWGRMKSAVQSDESNCMLGHMMIAEAQDFRGSIADDSISGACVACAAWHACFNTGFRRCVLLNLIGCLLWLISTSSVLHKARLAPHEKAYLIDAGKWLAAFLTALSLLSQIQSIVCWSLFCKKNGFRASNKWLTSWLNTPWVHSIARLAAGGGAVAPVASRPLRSKVVVAKEVNPMEPRNFGDGLAGALDAEVQIRPTPGRLRGAAAPAAAGHGAAKLGLGM